MSMKFAWDLQAAEIPEVKFGRVDHSGIPSLRKGRNALNRRRKHVLLVFLHFVISATQLKHCHNTHNAI